MRPDDDAVSATPPTAGWRLIVRRQFATADKIYPPGSEVSAEALGKNYRSFLSSHFCEWQPASVPVTAHPCDRPPPPPPPPRGRPPIEIVDDSDVVLSWRRTLALMTERCDGDAGIARDLLLVNNQASDLYRRAVHTACMRLAKQRNTVSVSPDQIRPPL